MPWFKVDDTFPLHSKVMAAGNGAIGLWTRAGAWSMQQLTDGFIPTHVARTLGSPAEARRLVAVGLWVEDEEGYRFHEWGDRQPSREQVEGDRHAAQERQRRAREKAKSQRDSEESSHSESRRDSQRSSPVSHGPPDPTRPDPETEGAASETGEGDQQGQESARKKRASQLPDDFEPNDTNRRLAEARGLDLAALLPQFMDHHRAKGSTMKDWHAALNTWIRRERAPVVGSANGTGPQVVTTETPPEPPPEEVEDDPDQRSAWYRAWRTGQPVVTGSGRTIQAGGAA